MDTLHVHDGCEELRVEVNGYLSGQLTEQLQTARQNSQSSVFWRRLVVDISSLKGYDPDGHRLLHEIYQQGATFVAPTPQSLDFLAEISSGVSTKAVPAAVWHSPDRSLSPRPRHRAGLGRREINARYR